jgi:hypothetical protein
MYKIQFVKLENVTFLGEYAFYLCYNLKTTILPKVNEMSRLCFSKCYSLEYIEVDLLAKID